MDLIYFSLIYSTVSGMITNFSNSLMTSVMGWVSAIAITLFTLWIIIQGYRILSGQSRDSMLGMVLNMSRAGIILIAASTLAFIGGDLQSFVTGTALPAINSLVTTGSIADGSSSTSVANSIDQNLAYTQIAMAFIDTAQGLNTSQSGANTTGAAATTFAAVVGVAGPPMTAGALLLTYQIALALFIGLGPLFIMCLIFDQTKSLFQGWLMYGLSTMFSLAVLNVMVTIVLKITLAVAMAMWASTGILSVMGLSASGLTSQAMQQGGLGMLMSVLIISAPSMAGKFFSAVSSEFRGFLPGEREQARQTAFPRGAAPGPAAGAAQDTPASRPNYSLPPSSAGRTVNNDVVAGTETSNIA